MTPTHRFALLALLPFASLPPSAVAQPPGAQAVAQGVAPAALPEQALVPYGTTPAAPPVAAAAQGDEADEALADAPDEPQIREEIEAESQELEDLRRAEEESNVQAAPHDEGVPPEDEERIALLPELGMSLSALRAKYDIPIDVNDQVVAYIRFFQSRGARAHFVKWMGRYHRYDARYRQILREEGLPQDTIFLAMIESGFGNFARSRAAAVGPWQFIASTGKSFGLKQDFWVDERRDPERAARAAARFLEQLHGATDDWRLAWAGYNAGLGRIRKAQAKGHEDFWEMAAVPGKKVLRAETKGYVPKLMAAAIIVKHPEAFGFRPEEIEPLAWTDYREVEIPNATLLSVIARAAGTTERELIDLNPELRRSCTPPRPYRLKIPAASAEAFARNWPEVRNKVRLTFAGHVVRRGDTLSGIAHRYGVPVQGIVELNGVKSARRLRPGQELLIPRPVGASAVARAEPAAAEPARQARRAARAAPAAGEGDRQLFRVRSGDTLWSISQRHGVSLADLCRWNGIRNPDRHKLMPGATLVVEGG